MIDDVALNFSPGSLYLLNAILAVVMFSIAIDILPRDFTALARASKALVAGIASQFVVLPALTFLLVITAAPQASIALGLIRPDLNTAGTEVEINIYGELRKAVVQADQPLWDPQNERLRA